MESTGNLWVNRRREAFASLTGVGVYSALLIKREIDGVSRFPNYKNLISWIGLASELCQSGGIECNGYTTKQGCARGKALYVISL